MSNAKAPFDPKTLAFLKTVFEETCDLVPPHKRTHEMRSAIAVRILKYAAQGERNSRRLRTFALEGTIETRSPPQRPDRRTARVRIDDRRYK